MVGHHQIELTCGWSASIEDRFDQVGTGASGSSIGVVEKVDSDDGSRHQRVLHDVRGGFQVGDGSKREVAGRCGLEAHGLLEVSRHGFWEVHVEVPVEHEEVDVVVGESADAGPDCAVVACDSFQVRVERLESFRRRTALREPPPAARISQPELCDADLFCWV